MSLQADSHLIDCFETSIMGPSILFTGGLHGNEPAGVKALKKVCHLIRKFNCLEKGRLCALKGNIYALRTHNRFIDEDLNRLWGASRIESIKHQPAPQRSCESSQLLNLLSHIEPFFDQPASDKIFIDLHTTSASGSPFTITSDHPFNLQLAETLSAPIILNFTAELKNTTNVYMEENDLYGFAFESGQHTDPQSVDIHEAAIWSILHYMGMLKTDFPIEPYRKSLQKVSFKLPTYTRAFYRHEIKRGTDFQMLAGFENFHPITAGEVVAYENTQAVKSPSDGLMLMPLYQTQGDEGFFLVEAVEEELAT